MLKASIVLALLILIPGALHVLRKRWGAPARYYGVVVGGLLLLLGLWNVPPTFLDKAPTLGFALVVAFCLLPPLAVWYSLQALTTDSAIPAWISIPGLVLASIGTLLVFTLFVVSRAGYIVG